MEQIFTRYCKRDVLPVHKGENIHREKLLWEKNVNVLERFYVLKRRICNARAGTRTEWRFHGEIKHNDQNKIHLKTNL